MTEQAPQAIEVETTGAGTATATVNREAHEAAQAAAAEETLLAGKFKTPADLEKAYTELQKKLGGGNEAAEATAEEEAKAAAAVAEEEAKADAGEETAEDDADAPVYGKAVDTALAAAEVDPKDAAAEFEANGTLSDETFEKFDKAGFPKEMVEAYLRGITPPAAQTEADVEAQISTIKASVGGDEAYAELSKFISAQYNATEIEAFNAEVGSGDTSKAMAAVAAAKARYQAEIGTEGNLLGGDVPKSEGGYETESQMLEDMKKPEYKKSQAFRDEVAAKIKASNFHVTR